MMGRSRRNFKHSFQLDWALDLATLASSILSTRQHWRPDNMKVTLPDMSCGHCVATVTKAVKALDASAEVKADLASKTVAIETSAPAPAVAKALEKAGYPATPA
jgi:copper chaperone